MKVVTVTKALLLLTSLLLTSCTLLQTQQLHDNTRQINVISNYEQIRDCRYISELVGSEGHWYTFFFISNTELTLASINDLKNQASDVGANTVYVEEHMGFGTSVDKHTTVQLLNMSAHRHP